KQRQEKIRARREAPDIEGLAEIAVLFRQAGAGRPIENTGKAERAVQQETAERDVGAMKFALEQIVREHDRLVHVVEDMTHRTAARLRHHGDVNLRRWFQQDMVE